LTESYKSVSSILPPIVHDKAQPNAPKDMLKIFIKKKVKEKKQKSSKQDR